MQLHLEACKGRENKKDIVSLGLEKRSTFGYTEKKPGEEEAHRLLLRARRFIDWVKERVG